MNNSKFTIVTFYQFKKFQDIENVKQNLKKFCFLNKLRGTIILADEGINGTISGLKNSVNEFKNKLNELNLNDAQIKESSYEFMPFSRMKIKIKKEIVTFDGKNYDVEKNKAKYLDRDEWNKFINKKNTLIIDVRNNFEYEMGTFEKAMNPKTKNFREFKKFVKKELLKRRDQNIALFCTGGIRCEKASSYMKINGFKKLYQLNGGILKYLENTPDKKSFWKGECFVFDNRVSLKNGLNKGTYELCHGCRFPVSKGNRRSKKYLKGISCPRCYNKLTIEKKKKLQERNKQIEISKKKGIYNPYIKLTTLDY